MPLDVRADRYGRNSFEGAYTELRTESLDQLHELLEPEGASSESSPKIASFIIKGTESTLAREFLQTLIPQRLKFKSVDNDTPDAWHVEVSYSEFPGVTNQNLDHWRHIDPWVRKRQQKEQQHLPESKRTIGVELTLTCSDATGQILFEDKVRGDMAPAELDFDMPLDHQFRASSLVAAISQLKALTASVNDPPHSAVPEDIFWSNEAPSENRDPFSGDFIFEEVAVDNSWLDGAHGIPIPARSVN